MIELSKTILKWTFADLHTLYIIPTVVYQNRAYFFVSVYWSQDIPFSCQNIQECDCIA